MKYLLSFAAMCMFLFVGSILPGQSQAGPEREMTCDNGDCESTVWSDGDTWTLTINCDGHPEHKSSGTGSYGGSLCGMTMD